MKKFTNELLGIFLIIVLIFTRWENYRWILPLVVMISVFLPFGYVKGS